MQPGAEQASIPVVVEEQYREMVRVLCAAIECEAYEPNVRAYAKHLEGFDPALLGRAIMAADQHFPPGKLPAPRKLLHLAQSLKGRRSVDRLPPDPGEPEDLPAGNAFQKLAKQFREESRANGWNDDSPPPRHVGQQRMRRIMTLWEQTRAPVRQRTLQHKPKPSGLVEAHETVNQEKSA